MSAREWKPGDVAMVTWKALGQWRTDLRFRTADDRPPRWIGTDGSWIGDVTAKEARPLVLVDPEDREAVERLADELVGVGAHKGGCGWDLVQAALREFVDPTPPRIDEPGTWGVVKASCPHSDTRREWVHHPDGNWWPAFDYSTVPERTPLPDDWADLIDPVLVREGVTQ